MNISLNTVYSQFMLKIGVTVLASFIGQSALGACANKGSDLGKIIIDNGNGNPIYFCAEKFTKDDDLAFKPTAKDIVAGGNQAIEIINNSIQVFPLSSEIDLKGFNVGNLDFNKVVTYLPYPKGSIESTPYLFSFYSGITSIGLGLNTCQNAWFDGSGNQYERIKKYLRSNASLFKANGNSFNIGTNGDDVAELKNVVLKGPSNSVLPANIYLYHANPTSSNMGFREGNTYYCLVGLKARVEILPSNTDLTSSGEHKLNIKFESGN